MKKYFDIALNHLEKVKKAKEEINKKELLLKNFDTNNFEKTFYNMINYLKEKGLYD